MTAVVLRDRAGHQVPRRRLDRDPGNGHLLHDHAGDPPPLRQRRERAGRRRGRQDDADPGARDRPGLQAAQADAAGAGLRQGDPAERARGGLRLDQTRDTAGCSRSGTSAASTSRSRCCTRPTASWSARSSSTPPRSAANPRGVVAVYIPEYVVGRWWEQLLHNQTALRLKGRLLFTPGVMVTSVPYQLRSSEIARERGCAGARRPARRPGRGEVDRRGESGRAPRAPRRRRPRAGGAGPSRVASGSRSRSARSRTAATASRG